MDDELKGLAAQFDAIYSQAYGEIIPLVIQAIWSGQESEETVAGIFEKMLDFLGDEDFLLAFRLLCRTYYSQYKDMVTEYVGIYKDLYDAEDTGES